MREQTAKKPWAVLLALVAVVALAAGLLVGCGGDTSASSTESVTGKAETAGSITPTAELDGGVLKMGVDAEGYAPSVWQENGTYTGYDYDLALEATHRLGWELQVVPIQWDQMVGDIDDQVVDCIWNGLTMNVGERVSQLGFTQPYMKSDIVVVVRLDNNQIKTLADLKGKRIAAQDGSTSAKVLESNLAGIGELSTTDGTLQLVSNMGLAFQRLASGEVDAVVTDEFNADFYVSDGENTATTGKTTQSNKASNTTSYRVLTDSATEKPIILYRSLDAVGIDRGNVALADDITTALYEMYEDGTVKAILDKYADYGVRINDWCLTEIATRAITGNTGPQTTSEASPNAAAQESINEPESVAQH